MYFIHTAAVSARDIATAADMRAHVKTWYSFLCRIYRTGPLADSDVPNYVYDYVYDVYVD